MFNPLMTLLAGILAMALGFLIFWPDSGLFWRWQRARERTERVLSEDALKHIYKLEIEGRRPTAQSVAGALQITVDQAVTLLSILEARNLLQHVGAELRLTAVGRNYALHIVRSHRLWERYLADQTGFTETEWHDQAERYEHILAPEEADALSAQLGHPTYDPHGDPIPTASGELVSPGGQPLTAATIGEPVRIVHLEDEPETVYAQLVAEGLYLGMEVQIAEVAPYCIRFWANGDEHVLAPIVASNIFVVPLPRGQIVETHPRERLSALRVGEQGRVITISRACRGAERRRLMDLGVVPGTLIEAEMSSPTGDPTAYRIRGALIVLRHEQADLINITRELEEAVS
jgi:DtxR family Mn-dependent transcriptional regulator